MAFQLGQVLLHALPPEQFLDFAAENRAHPLGRDVEQGKNPAEHQHYGELAPLLRQRVNLAETYGAEGDHGHVERVPGGPVLDHRIADRPHGDQGQRYDERQDVAWCQDRTPGKDDLRPSFVGFAPGIVTAAGAEVSLLQQSPRIPGGGWARGRALIGSAYSFRSACIALIRIARRAGMNVAARPTASRVTPPGRKSGRETGSPRTETARGSG